MVSFNTKHQTHFEMLVKFIALFSLLIGYFIYLSYQYDFSKGGTTVALTWSFFVLCTPIADAGFLLDFPIRLLFGCRMFFTEIIVWLLAISICTLTLWIEPEYYQTTLLTRVYQQILTTPFPYWSIIVLCCIGTFASIYFGDEMMDVIGHHLRHKHHHHSFKVKAIALISITGLVVSIYYKLINELGVVI